MEDQARGDGFEGGIRFDYEVDHENGLKPNEDHIKFLENHNFFLGNTTTLRMTDMFLSGPEFYIYCTSTENSMEIANLFKAVACVQISKPYLVAGKIQKQLIRQNACVNNYYYSGSVRYYNRPFDIDNYKGVPHILLKEAIPFENQKEFRFCYQSIVNNPQPIILDVPQIRSFCRLVEISR